MHDVGRKVSSKRRAVFTYKWPPPSERNYRVGMLDGSNKLKGDGKPRRLITLPPVRHRSSPADASHRFSWGTKIHNPKIRQFLKTGPFIFVKVHSFCSYFRFLCCNSISNKIQNVFSTLRKFNLLWCMNVLLLSTIYNLQTYTFNGKRKNVVRESHRRDNEAVTVTSHL